MEIQSERSDPISRIPVSTDTNATSILNSIPIHPSTACTARRRITRALNIGSDQGINDLERLMRGPSFIPRRIRKQTNKRSMNPLNTTTLSIGDCISIRVVISSIAGSVVPSSSKRHRRSQCPPNNLARSLTLGPLVICSLSVGLLSGSTCICSLGCDSGRGCCSARSGWLGTSKLVCDPPFCTDPGFARTLALEKPVIGLWFLQYAVLDQRIRRPNCRRATIIQQSSNETSDPIARAITSQHRSEQMWHTIRTLTIIPTIAPEIQLPCTPRINAFEASLSTTEPRLPPIPSEISEFESQIRNNRVSGIE